MGQSQLAFNYREGLHHRGTLQCFSAMLVLFGAREGLAVLKRLLPIQ